MELLNALGGILVGLIMAAAGYLGLKKMTSTESAAAPVASDPVEIPAAAADLYTNAGDVIVDGIYAKFAAGDTGATKPYNNVDPDQYPKVWARLSGVKAGKVVLGLQVDGRVPTAQDELVLDDVSAYVGGHSIAVFTYPKYGPYRTPAMHEVVVLVGRVKDDEHDVTTVEWVKQYPFDVTLTKVA